MKTTKELFTAADNIISDISSADPMLIKETLRDINNIAQSPEIKNNADLVSRCKEKRLKLKSKTQKLVDEFNNKVHIGHVKKIKTAEKSAATRSKNKPGNNITHFGATVTYEDMLSILLNAHNLKKYDDRSYTYDKRFLEDIANKKALTSKQHNYLCKVALKFNYHMPEKKIRITATETICEHHDLGSLGYTHGDTVECPFCGKMAEVW